MNFKRFHESKNLFDKTATNTNNGYVQNSRLNASDGSVFYNVYGSISEYIAVNPNTDYTLDFGIVSENQNLAVCFYDTSKVFLRGYACGSVKQFTFNSGNDAKYCRITYINSSINSTMLNSGNTALPYEPYGNTWHNTPHYIHNTSTDTITTLPADIYANDTTATVGLKGDMVQSGTPTPTTPIQPQECGEITANVLSVYKENYSINEEGVETPNGVAMIYKANVVVSGSTFTLTFGGLSIGDTVRIHAYTGDTWKRQIAAIVITQVPFAFTVASGVDNIRISIRKTATDVAMIDGQYKIPILSNSTTTPVYLGEVQTTRNTIKKVFTGSETWYYGNGIFTWLTTTTSAAIDVGLCSHFSFGSPDIDGNFTITLNAQQYVAFQFRHNSISSLSDFKQWLADQYTAGTPVTVWYRRTTPLTTTLNEPLRKIGDYADEVSGITIPVTAGENTLSVDTTLQPSEVTVNYHGWHPVSAVHERENGEWD